MKTVPVGLKELSDVVSKEVVKKTVYSKLNTKVNNLENKFPDTNLIVNTNSIAQHVIQIKNLITINVNMSVKSTMCAKKIIAGILAHVFVRIVGI